MNNVLKLVAEDCSVDVGEIKRRVLEADLFG
jgi:hypothetical protein